MVKKEVAPIKFFTARFFDNWNEIYVNAYKTHSEVRSKRYTRLVDTGKTVVNGGKIRWVWSYDYSYNTPQVIAKKLNKWMEDFRKEYPNAEFTVLCKKIKYFKATQERDCIGTAHYLITKDNKVFIDTTHF